MQNRIFSRLSLGAGVAVLIAALAPVGASAMQSSVKDLLEQGLIPTLQSRGFNNNPQCENDSLMLKRAMSLGYGGGGSDDMYPDLRYAWDSNFGKIFWLGGSYGSSVEKTIHGQLRAGNRGAPAVFTGYWGSRNKESGQISWRGEVEFVFDSCCTFWGRYKTASGDWKEWNGSFNSEVGSHHFNVVADADRAQFDALRTQLEALETKFRQGAGICGQ